MLIIVEGCDRSGKGTQCNAIKEWLEINTNTPTHIIHSRKVAGKTPEAQLALARRTYYDLFQIMAKASSHHLILDRSYLDEEVYGPLYRNQDNYYIWDFEKEFVHNFQTQVALFLLDVDSQTLISREDGDSFSSSTEMKEKERSLFKQVFEKSLIGYKYIIDANRDAQSITDDITSKISDLLPKLNPNDSAGTPAQESLPSTKDLIRTLTIDTQTKRQIQKMGTRNTYKLIKEMLDLDDCVQVNSEHYKSEIYKMLYRVPCQSVPARIQNIINLSMSRWPYGSKFSCITLKTRKIVDFCLTQEQDYYLMTFYYKPSFFEKLTLSSFSRGN